MEIAVWLFSITHPSESPLPSIFDKLRRGFRKAEPATSPALREQPPDTSAPVSSGLESQGLFIIGAARSGTTILQNALNDSGDIFLLGEPSLHQDPGTSDFATRYNAMHRSWGNQETKSSYCPPLFESDASWDQYLARQAKTYRYVGAKIVINPEHAGEQARCLFDFQCRHFYASHYLFAFRNPLDVLVSTRGMAELSGARVPNGKEVLAGFFVVMQLFVRALRNLPHVEAVFHEAINADTFVGLGTWLGTPFPGAIAYYSGAKVRHYDLSAVPEADRALTAESAALYERFKNETLAGFALRQIEQNSGHFDPNHFTALGRLSLDVAAFVDRLAIGH